MRQLPSLNALRAFEATARHLSFTKAANELNVTAGAVSQQVKLLEGYLGVKLFLRKNRMIKLTQDARLGLPYFTEGLDRFAEGVNVIQDSQQNKPLTITLPPTFAARWLMPRLTDFQQQYPDVDVRIDATYKLIDIIHEDIDAGIRFGTGDYVGLQSDFLFKQEVIPVCSPSLLTAASKLKKPEDLKQHTLLHCDFFLNSTSQTQPDWDLWLAMMGVEAGYIDTTRGVQFAQHDLLVQAAIEGQGVALVASISAQKAIKEKLLVQPFDSGLPLEHAYYFISSKEKSNLKRVQSFRQWLLKEVNQDD
jgi:LysR family glycine cleavage system transcriptional activator